MMKKNIDFLTHSQEKLPLKTSNALKKKTRYLYSLIFLKNVSWKKYI